MAALVRKFRFQTATLNFLIVGHTHEDVDQMFAVLLALVLRRVRFKTPEELRSAIQVGMASVAAERGEVLHVEILSHVRAFDAWTNAFLVDPSGCCVARDNIQAPHSFTYKLRKDLKRSELVELVDRFGHIAHDLDVFCLTKPRMASATAFAPVLLLPNDRWLQANLHAPGGSHAKTPMTPDRAKHLREFADTLESLTKVWDVRFSYFGAANELRLLASGERAPVVSADGYLEAADALPHPTIPDTESPFFGHLPGACWRLLVKFPRIR